MLLPEQDGQDTAVAVTQDGKEPVVLDQPYAGAQLTQRGPEQYTSNAEEVQAQFGAALARAAGAPAQFTLYFVEGKDEFTDESKRIVDGVFAEIAKRPVPDVHRHRPHRHGRQRCGQRRARRASAPRSCARALIARGVAAENVVAIGRGKRELVVPTADGVAEPRNRRVEILVR